MSGSCGPSSSSTSLSSAGGRWPSTRPTRPARHRTGASWTTWVTGFLLAVTLAMHLLPAWYATATLETLAAVGQGGSGAGGIFDPLMDPKDLDPPPGRDAAPRPVAGADADPIGLSDRFTVLLLGVDLGPGRRTYNTDTMMVATIDPRSGASLISIPRDTFGTPLGDGRVYQAKLNSLLAYARIDPAPTRSAAPRRSRRRSARCSASRSTTSAPWTSSASPTRSMRWAEWT